MKWYSLHKGHFGTLWKKYVHSDGLLLIVSLKESLIRIKYIILLDNLSNKLI